jgi:hypothetical protein
MTYLRPPSVQRSQTEPKRKVGSVVYPWSGQGIPLEGQSEGPAALLDRSLDCPYVQSRVSWVIWFPLRGLVTYRSASGVSREEMMWQGRMICVWRMKLKIKLGRDTSV